jgi:hypothetical protein
VIDIQHGVETTGAGAAVVTITGHNEQAGSDATEAAKPAWEQMPVEVEKYPNAALNSPEPINAFTLCAGLTY